MKTGQSSTIHNIYSINKYLLGRCYSCNRKIYLNAWEHIIDFIYKENTYCYRCIDQVKNGIELKKFEQKKTTRRCRICKTIIQSIFWKYPYCEKHLDKKISKNFKFGEEVRKEARKTLNKKYPDRTLNLKGYLIKKLCYCQNIKCENRNTTYHREEMFIALRFESRRKLKFYFCSKECRLIFIENEDNKGLIFTKLNKGGD